MKTNFAALMLLASGASAIKLGQQTVDLDYRNKEDSLYEGNIEIDENTDKGIYKERDYLSTVEDQLTEADKADLLNDPLCFHGAANGEDPDGPNDKCCRVYELEGLMGKYFDFC